MAKKGRAKSATATKDGFTNFAAKIGYGAGNLASAGEYSFNYITRNRQQLEAMYRGSWLIGAAVDAPAEDMTRAGIDISSQLTPAQIEKLQSALLERVWDPLGHALRWARLFGGGLAVILIEGQKLSEPLRMKSIDRGTFKGMLVLDRWMVQPSVNDLITEYSPNIGKPRFYDVVADAPALPKERIHHSRCVRFEGLDLPYFQRLGEMMWGESVVERIFDRLTAFDSATLGTAQLVYRAHLRTLKVKDLRDTISMGGAALTGLLKQVDMMRMMQSNESITLLDAEDEYSADTYTFAGLSDVLMGMAEQLSGAVEVPLVRLFGQSPSGFSTGEADLANYYEAIRKKQETRLRQPMTMMLDVLCCSELGIDPPDDMTFTFRPLKVPTDAERASIGATVTSAVQSAWEAGLVTQDTALKELRANSRVSGIWTNITDEEIEDAKGAPPPNAEVIPGQSAEGSMGGAEQPLGIGEAQRHLASIGEQNAESDAATRMAGVAKQLRQLDALPADIGKPLDTIDFQGLPIVIENKRGSWRTAHDGSWKARMAADYGYVNGTGSAEGPMEGMDVFVGPLRHSPHVYIVDQRNLKTGAFDEHKAMLGFFTAESARRAYCDSYSDRGAERIMGVTHMPINRFKDWVTTGEVDQPLFRGVEDKRTANGV